MPQAFYCKDRQQLNLKHTSIKLFQQLSKPRISNKNSTDKASWGSGMFRQRAYNLCPTETIYKNSICKQN